MNTVAIIIARGGSKRIPRKNIKLFAGKPIITYSIETARQTGLFNRIIVSTDDSEISVIAQEFGAEVPFKRPIELADDFVGTAPVVIHALEWLEEHNFPVEFFCCMYATAPFMQAEYVKKGYAVLQEKRATTSFSVTTYPYPIFRSLKLTDSGRLEMVWPEYRNSRSQDLPETYHDAGQFYWGDAGKFLKEKELFSSDAVPVVLPRYLVHDIDTPEDWETAEKMWLACQQEV